MTAQQIIEAVGNRKRGTSARIIVNREAKIYKKLAGEAGEIRKRSVYNLQLASYGNRAPVKQAVEAGEREAPQLPVWVEKTEQFGPVNFWIGKNGQVYLALPTFGDKSKAIVQWTRDGKKVNKMEIARFLTAAETPAILTAEEMAERGQVGFNAIKLENIERIR